LGKLDSALVSDSIAIRLLENGGQPRDLAQLLGNVAEMRRQLGQVNTARSTASRSLAIFQQIGDSQGVVTALINLGEIANDEGQYGAGARFYNDALINSRSRGDVPNEGLALLGLAESEFGARSYLTAIDNFSASLSVFRQTRDSVQIAYAAVGMGLTLERVAKYSDSRLMLSMADSIYGVLGSQVADPINARQKQGLRAALSRLSGAAQH
jgi:tetratricopeptide (TPR) repeat protein